MKSIQNGAVQGAFLLARKMEAAVTLSFYAYYVVRITTVSGTGLDGNRPMDIGKDWFMVAFSKMFCSAKNT